jgi:hypothetical protein
MPGDLGSRGGAPFRDRLRIFRNRLGFHGSANRKHGASGFEPPASLTCPRTR